MTESKPSIFISYGRGDDHNDHTDPDKSFLRKLYNDLTDDGYTVWWDRESMPARDLEFIKEIENAITDHDRMILIVGPHSIGSSYVRYEWEHAHKLCKPITPILLVRDKRIEEDDKQYGQIPDALSNYHALSALDWDTQPDVYKRMLDELKRVLGQEERMGKPHGFPMLPKGYIQREGFTAIEKSLLTKTVENAPVVIEPHEQVRAVQGTGGIGKTTLANALGRSCRVRRHFLDGTYFVRLGRVGDISLPLVQATLGMALGDKDTTGYIDEEQGRMRLSLLLRDKQALIVLDDVWDIKQKRAFDALGDNCRMLITTRQRDIVPQSTTHQLNKLTQAEGIELIGRWLDRTPTDPNPHLEQERHILELVDGYTLAIAISAAKLAGGYTHDSLIKRLEAGRTFKDLVLGKGEDKNDNLEKAIFLSYDDLSEDNQRRFRQLGVLAPSVGFDMAIAQAIWDEDEFDTEDGLQALLNAALLDRDEDTGEWKQHSLLRAYAAALLSDDDEHDLFTRYVTYITDTCTFDPLKMGDWDTQYEHLYPHIDYLGDTLNDRYLQDNDHYQNLMGEFVMTVKNYILDRPLIRDGAYRGLDWLITAINLYAESDQTKRQSTMLSDIGVIYNNLGQKQNALEMYQQSLDIKREIGDRSGEATTLNNIGEVYQSQGQLQETLDMYQQALPIRREVGDRSGEATTLNNIGSVYDALGRKGEALDMYQQALPIHRGVGNRSMEATTLNNIGAVYRSQGHNQKALEMYQQALPILREVGNRSVEATTLNNIGLVYGDLGRKGEALEMYQQALPILREIGNRSVEAIAISNIGGVYRSQGQNQKALKMYQQALPIQREIGDRSGEATTLNNIGLVYWSQGQHQEALEMYQQALPILREVGNRSVEAIAISNIGGVYRSQGQNQKALKMYQQALPIQREIGDRSGEVVTCYNIGTVYYGQGDLDAAIQYFQQAYDIGEDIQSQHRQTFRNTLEQVKRERDGG